jgi:hypothetical protein
VRAQSGSGRFWHGAEQRLARAAGCITMAGLAALPFAGGLSTDTEVVATGPTTTTTAPPVAPPPSAPPAPAAAPAAPVDAIPVEAPPIVVADAAAGIGEAAPEVAAEVAPVPVVAPVAAATITTVGPSSSSSVALAAHPERLWVVSIGIDDYPGDRHDLRAADDDAVAVSDTFTNLGVPADHVYEILNGSATVDGILAAADWLVAHAGPADTAVFFYAGHVRQIGPGTEAIVAADGRWVSDWYLASRFVGLRSADAWFAIAGCFGGGFTELLAPGRILTGASPAGQLAYENAAFGRSYMVEYLFVRAINGRGADELTVQAAVEWANDRLAEENPDRMLFQEDDAGHAVSLDGTDRRSAPPGGNAPPTPLGASTPAQPPSATPPPTTAPARQCLLGLLCG